MENFAGICKTNMVFLPRHFRFEEALKEAELADEQIRKAHEESGRDLERY